jgi:hypothetical protein
MYSIWFYYVTFFEMIKLLKWKKKKKKKVSPAQLLYANKIVFLPYKGKAPVFKKHGKRSTSELFLWGGKPCLPQIFLLISQRHRIVNGIEYSRRD